MTKIIAVVTLFWFNPATGTVDETEALYALPHATSLAQCHRTVELDAFWLSVRGDKADDTDAQAKNGFLFVGAKAECIVWREA
jgi:hypothetical protein